MSTVDLAALEEWDDLLLAGVLDAVQRESSRRALERCEPESLVAEGFDTGFTQKGLPKDPYLRSGIVVCLGGKVDRSAMSHECAFVRVDSAWVWESPDKFDDVIRHLPGPRPSMRSVSLVTAREGMALDLVSAKLRMGVHQLTSVRSFEVIGGELALVSARAVNAVDHRR